MCELDTINIIFLIIACVCCTMLCLYYHFDKPSLPRLYYADTELNRHVINKVTRLTSTYSPPILLKNRHLQCFLGGIGVHKVMDFKREYIHMNDNGVVSLDWISPCDISVDDSSPILLILSGIIGTKIPIAFICQLASRRRFRVVVFNKRGHDNSELTTPILQTFGDPRDLRQCVKHIHRMFPQAKMAAYGSSAGAGLLTCYLGDYAGKTLISAAAFISSGFNLPHLCLTNTSRFYERILVSQLRTMLIKPHRDILQSTMDLNAVNKCTTVREFDYHVYCKMHGYRDVAELWTDNNPMKRIHKIDVPVLCINSLDDPVCLSSNIPYDLFERPGWMLVTTDKGSHSTFIENWRLDYWGDKCALDYIEAVLEFQQT